MTDRIALGVIRKAHGVRGEASVEAWTASLDRFSELRRVFLVSPDEIETREVMIETARAHGDRALVKFAGIDRPEDLRALRNWTIEIPASEAKAPGENEYFIHELIGMRLVDAKRADRGEVVDAYESGAGLLLSVRSGERTFEVPFAAGICTEIDRDRRTIVVDLPAGIENLDEAES
ncbi:MAG TPA: ribosome maturation factor RimM [Thermoanaerobaculia bacterium]|nr:ribosome maturation factor RimM [Thermoanaerobaculia bacterium]